MVSRGSRPELYDVALFRLATEFFTAFIVRVQLQCRLDAQTRTLFLPRALIRFLLIFCFRPANPRFLVVCFGLWLGGHVGR